MNEIYHPSYQNSSEQPKAKKAKSKFGGNILAGSAGALLMLTFVLTAGYFTQDKLEYLFANAKSGSYSVSQQVDQSLKDLGYDLNIMPAVALQTVAELADGTQVVSEEIQVIDIVKKMNPAVISIVITKDVPIIEKYYENVPYNNPFGFNYYQQVPRYRENGTQKQKVGGGSGFLVSSDGLIVTNKHVVSEPEAEYTVFTNDGTSFSAEIVAQAQFNDIAILKIEGDSFPYIEFADSDKVQVGQTVIAIGNSLGEFRNTVSKGVISGLSRSISTYGSYGQVEKLEGVLQTDAAINPGNSGGPLLDLRGQVVGVNVAISSGAENIGFALPANSVKKIVDSVKEYGRIVRPYLGIRYIPITAALQERSQLEVDYGVIVMRGELMADLAVIPGSPADKAGLQENDIILEIDGQKLDLDNSLVKVVVSKAVGEKVELIVLRLGEEIKLEAVLEEAPE